MVRCCCARFFETMLHALLHFVIDVTLDDITEKGGGFVIPDWGFSKRRLEIYLTAADEIDHAHAEESSRNSDDHEVDEIGDLP